MPPAILDIDPVSTLLKIHSLYKSLIQASGSPSPAESGLGGSLLYAGELDDEGRSITLGGNIAGCATLVATPDPDAQRQAIRDGVVDFLVTSLDEALRILKNEIRKRSTVAVCTGVSSAQIESEMLERGVHPDLTRKNAANFQADFASSALMTVWYVESSPAKWLPKLDSIALDCLDAADTWTRRWVRLAPRYLARVAPSHRVVMTGPDFAEGFVQKIREAFDRGEIEAAATIRVISTAGTQEHHFARPQKA